MTNYHTTAQAERYRPEAAVGNDNRLPPHFANEPFVLVFYPTAWEWRDGHGFLPSLARVHFKPGVNGVAEVKGGRPDPQGAFANVAKKGGIILPPGTPALGPWADYVIRYPVNWGRETAYHYCWMGMEYEQTGQQHAEPVGNGARWTEFLVYLRDHSGLITRPPLWVLNRILSVQEDRLNRLTEAGRAEVPDAKRTAARITEIRAEIERLTPDRGEFIPSPSSSAPIATSASAEVAAMLPRIPVPEPAQGASKGKPRRDGGDA